MLDIFLSEEGLKPLAKHLGKYECLGDDAMKKSTILAGEADLLSVLLHDRAWNVLNAPRITAAAAGSPVGMSGASDRLPPGPEGEGRAGEGGHDS